MLVAVIVLAVLTAASLGAVAYLLRRPARDATPEPDDAAARALDASPRPAGAYAETRRLISIEILNPIELAGSRGWLAGLAGSLVPKFTRRVVHDQVLKILKHELDAHHVVADVRLHTLRSPAPPSARPADEVQRIDFDSVGDDENGADGTDDLDATGG